MDTVIGDETARRDIVDKNAPGTGRIAAVEKNAVLRDRRIGDLEIRGQFQRRPRGLRDARCAAELVDNRPKHGHNPDQHDTDRHNHQPRQLAPHVLHRWVQRLFLVLIVPDIRHDERP